jgi:hypothetical protein
MIYERDRVIDITNGHFIHAGPLEGIGVSIYLSIYLSIYMRGKCANKEEDLN